MEGTELLGLLFIIMGIMVILITLSIKYIKNKRCTVEVQAKFRRLNSYARERGGIYYGSVYDYTYNGITYECEVQGSGKAAITIYINPNKPKEIFHRNSGGRIIFISLGIIFIFFGFLIYFNI